MAQQLLTAVVGSYPQPDWLIDRALLTKMMAPRVRVQEVWRIPPERLEQAQDDRFSLPSIFSIVCVR